MNKTTAQLGGVACMLGALTLAGCNAGMVGGVDPIGVPAPTVNQPVTRTANSAITITGGKDAEVVVWLHVGRDASATRVAEADGSTTWSYDMTLLEGPNLFAVFATDKEGSLFSARVGPFPIELDTTPPEPPAITAPTTPTADATGDVLGTRAADGDLCMRIGQNPDCAQVAALDGGTSFSQTAMTLGAGVNTFCFRSADDLGNTSAEVCTDIVRIGAPTITFVRPVDGGVLGGTTVRVAITIEVGATDGEALDTVQVCFDGADCQTPLLNNGLYEATVTPSGTLANGVGYDITATATNVSSVSGTETITISYNEGGITVLSDNSTAGHSQDVAMVMDASGNLHAAWSDECFSFGECQVAGVPGLPYDIFYRKHDGNSWSDIVQISDDPADDDSQAPSIAVDIAGNIHIAWADSGKLAAGDTDSSSDIFVRVMAADGTLEDTQVIAHAADVDSAPQLAAGGDGSIHLAWERLLAANNGDIDIYHARWAPDSVGGTVGVWGGATLVTDHADDGRSANPRLVVEGSTSDALAWVVWQEGGDIDESESSAGNADEDIFLRSVSSTGTLAPTVLVSDYAGRSRSQTPALSIDGDGVLHIAWVDDANLQDPVFGKAGADPDAWYRTYDPSNTTFSSYRLFSDSAAGANTPAVVTTSDGTAVVAWAEAVSGNGEIFYRAMKSGFSGNSRLVSTGTDALSISPVLVIDINDNLNVIWEDDSSIIAADLDRPAQLLDPGPDHDIFWKQLFAIDDWAVVP